MKSSEIQNNVKGLTDNFQRDEFIFDLLIAYGISKTSVTRLKKGDFNLSKEDGEILYKKKVFFKEELPHQLLSSIDEISGDERILKHKPRFVILTDFKQLVAKDLKLGRNLDIPLSDLPEYFDFFLPLAGSEVYNSSNDNEADRNASYKMASLYDLLVEENPSIYNSKESIHELNIFLSRLLFCFFAEDTEIFEKDSIFTNTLAQQTSDDGSDTNLFLDSLFDRLDSKSGDGYPSFLAQFPYVNGGLFGQKISSPKFNTKARKMLIELGDLNWSEINPDIFGSMIQAVVDNDYRSDLGMHYTSVTNILKLIKPLFLDELYEAYENAKTVKQLNSLVQRIANIKFFDPACGSGNFLIITYKEIRLLEIKILQKITDLEDNPTFKWTSVQLSQFHGIEIDDFAHEMAILSLWLAEHQMNRVFEDMLFDYGKSKPILPLKETGQIKQGNATRINWNEVCQITIKDEVYVIGNPPYYGSRKQNKEQKEDLKFVFGTNFKSLDYVSSWFLKGARYIERFNAKCAFVATNSICQGLMVGLLWDRVLSNNIEIGFAHQSFKWTNSAKGNAGVTVIIVALRNRQLNPKFIFTKAFKRRAGNINPYLVDGPDIIVKQRSQPISDFPEMNFGNMPADGGNLLFSENEKDEFLTKEPKAAKWIKQLISADEFINGKKRYCLWLEGVEKKEYQELPLVRQRVEATEVVRLNSSRPQLAKTPHLFAQITQPSDKEFILVPGVTSEGRDYIPIGLFSGDKKINNRCFCITSFEPYLFGVIHSRMHMIWIDAVGGKVETRYQYSKTLCYNTFPFPVITTRQKENLNQYVFDILDERAKYPSETMAHLYNPDTMPRGLLNAHQELDAAVEQCYRLRPFENDTERLEYLFKKYEEMVKKDTLFANQKRTRIKTKQE
jgi:hypothetical protein